MLTACSLIVRLNCHIIIQRDVLAVFSLGGGLFSYDKSVVNDVSILPKSLSVNTEDVSGSDCEEQLT